MESQLKAEIRINGYLIYVQEIYQRGKLLIISSLLMKQFPTWQQCYCRNQLILLKSNPGENMLQMRPVQTFSLTGFGFDNRHNQGPLDGSDGQMDKYHRSLRLKCHFKDDQIIATDGTSIGPFNDTSCLKLQSKSKYNPPMGSNNLETVITMNELGLQDSILQDKH